MSFCENSDADDGNGNVTVISAPRPDTFTSAAVRFVVFSASVGADEADDEADADELLLPLDVPEVLEQDAMASAMTGIELNAAMRAVLEVTRRPYPALRELRSTYMPAISFSTRSSTLRNGSLHKTVRAA